MTSVLNPEIPAGAYDEFLPGAVDRARTQREWTPADGALPALYLSHGAPMLFNDPVWLRQLLDWSQSLPKPKAILIVSAHWEAAPLMMSAPGAGTPLFYDFTGFDPRYYAMKYPTPDATGLARRVAALMPGNDPVYQHPSRGLDHGAWVPLMAMYPLADIPVVQLSMPTHDPDRLIEIGARLRALRDEGVMVIGSGFMTHGTRFIDLSEAMRGKAAIPGWSSDFDAWAADALARGDVDELSAYVSRAPGMPYAHPTPDHYIPLFVTLGASGDPGRPVKTAAIEGYQIGLSKRSFQTQ
jgi:4,5-DOPA dioxygenase extradiol